MAVSEVPLPTHGDAAVDADAAAPTLPEAAPRLHVPVGVRSFSIAVIAVIATCFALRWASAVFVPLLLGVTLSYALGPLVDALVTLRVPRPVGAGVAVAALVGALAGTGWTLADEADALVESLPQAAAKVREAMRAHRPRKASALERVQQAAAEIEKAAQDGAPPRLPPPARGVTRVQIEPPRFDIRQYLWSGTLGLATLLAQATIVVFITFFLLAAGDRFRRKLARIAGPTFAQKKITVQALDEIDAQIQRYLLVQIAISVIVGAATWAAYAALGLNNAAAWGVIAGVLNLLPYVGAIAVTAASALLAFLQFGTPDMALVFAGVSFALHAVSGYLLTPWLTSRASRLNAVAVFVGMLAFGWLWGVWGLLLGVPVLMMLKAVCDRVDELKAVGELLGT